MNHTHVFGRQPRAVHVQELLIEGGPVEAIADENGVGLPVVRLLFAGDPAQSFDWHFW